MRSTAGTWVRRTLSGALFVLGLLALLPAGGPGREYIVKYKASAAWGLAVDAPFAVVSQEEKEALERAGLLEWSEEDGEAVLCDAGPTARLLERILPCFTDRGWNLRMIGADAASRLGYRGQGVRVGVLDSGVSPHPGLEGRLLPGRNYMEGAEDPTDTSDSHGHGTQVAGLIAAADEKGGIGAAPDAQIVPLKITDGKTADISVICQAIYGGVDDYGCDVLSMSLGVSMDYEALREAVAYAEDHGVLVISAVGNEGSDTLFYPACYDSVIGVGAVDHNGSLYFRSNRNSSVFLTAPGAGVQSIAAGGGETLCTGTSFSVPQAAAAAAVLLSMDETLTPPEIRDLMAGTARDQGPEGYDESYGHGILNLKGCMEALAGEELE